MAWDVGTAPVSAKSRQDLLDRADAFAILMGNPRLVVDYYQDAYTNLR